MGSGWMGSAEKGVKQFSATKAQNLKIAQRGVRRGCKWRFGHLEHQNTFAPSPKHLLGDFGGFGPLYQALRVARFEPDSVQASENTVKVR